MPNLDSSSAVNGTDGDWSLTDYENEDGYKTLVFLRLLNTGDDNGDIVIQPPGDATTNIIMAYGEVMDTTIMPHSRGSRVGIGNFNFTAPFDSQGVSECKSTSSGLPVMASFVGVCLMLLVFFVM